MSIIVIEIVVAVIIAAVIGAGLGYTMRKRTAEAQIGSAEEEAKRIVADAEEKGETKKKEALLEAKEEIHRQRQELDRETKERRSELQRQERRVVQKEENLDRKLDSLEKKEDSLNRKEARIDKTQQAIDEIINGNFAPEITKFKDVAQAFEMYKEISAVVSSDDQGFDIFKTADGENWEVVTRDGFGDKYNYGALRFLTTEEGMYITTGNPFFGGQLYLLSNDKAQPGKTVLLGDVNGDGEVSVFDAIAMQKYLADKPVAVFIEEAADVNGDGVIDTNDAIQIQKYTSGKTVKYPIGEPING